MSDETNLADLLALNLHMFEDEVSYLVDVCPLIDSSNFCGISTITMHVLHLI